MSRVEQALRRGLGASGEFPADQVADVDLGRKSDGSLDWLARMEPEHDQDRPAGHGVPPQGSVPAAPTDIGTLFERADPDSAEKLVIAPDIRPQFVEQYRKLAAVLHRAQQDRGLKSVLVTSTLAGEGKTLSVANLALTLSESYRKRVLVIDADLRRPVLHRLFGVQPQSALNDLLKQPASTPIEPVQISELLYLLGATAPDADPMGVLASPGMRAVVERASATHDWVLIDSPPVALLPDANLLASIVDVAVLVIKAGLAPYQAILAAIEAIGRERMMGVILNHAEMSAASGNVDAYYAYFGRASGNGSGG
jgi:capsular exopolysaccharide synthesis family protein